LLPGQIYVSGITFIEEVFAPEQAAIALIVDGALDGNVRHHAFRFTVGDLLSIGVTSVGYTIKASANSNW
jgi:hypothetical protein